MITADPYSWLPSDAFRLIFTMLPSADQCRCRLVCRAWRQLVVPDELIFQVNSAPTLAEFRRVFSTFPHTRSVVIHCDVLARHLVSLVAAMPAQSARRLDRLSVRSFVVNATQEAVIADQFLPWLSALTQLTSLSLFIAGSALYQSNDKGDLLLPLQSLTRLELGEVEAPQGDRVLAALTSQLLHLSLAIRPHPDWTSFPLSGLARHTQLRLLSLDLSQQPLSESILHSIVSMTELRSLHIKGKMPRAWAQRWFAAMPALESVELDVLAHSSPDDSRPDAIMPHRLKRVLVLGRHCISSDQILQLACLRHLSLGTDSVKSGSFLAENARLAGLGDLGHIELRDPELPACGFAAFSALRSLCSLSLPFGVGSHSQLSDRGLGSIGLLTLLTSLFVRGHLQMSLALFPSNWSALSSLKSLQLPACAHLRHLSGLSALTALHTLRLDDSPTCNPELLAEVSHLTGLEILYIGDGDSRLPCATVLPPLLQLTRLRDLRLDTPDPPEDHTRTIARGLTRLVRLRTSTAAPGSTRQEVSVTPARELRRLRLPNQ